VGEESGFGGDEVLAGFGHGADGFEALGCPVGLGPGEQVGKGDFGVLADFEEGHGAIEEEGEEEGVVGQVGFEVCAGSTVFGRLEAAPPCVFTTPPCVFNGCGWFSGVRFEQCCDS
jgi:hypothetical protein